MEHQRKIVIVDDHPNDWFLGVFIKQLERHGFTASILEANRKAEAMIELVKNEKPELVITDLDWGDILGEEGILLFRALADVKMPSILYSGDSRVTEDYLPEEGQTIHVKGERMEVVIATINRLLSGN